ncbi:chaperonin 10-like protein [Geopyxis carbonaria]|nr:chaperonin 10-like protein [Geopyxis carbonaria]
MSTPPTMRAIRYHGTKSLKLDHIPRPTFNAATGHTVKIAPAFVGLCGSDLFEYLYGPKQIPVTPDAGTGDALPITIGHEFAGLVTAVAPGETAFSVGDRVAIEPTHKCRSCVYCRSGHGNLCVNFGSVGMNGGGGGLQEEVILPPRYLHKLPPSVSLQAGALVEPLAVAYHAISHVQPPPKTVLILGAGPIGLALLLVLRALGITDVLVSEPSPTRRALAEKFGAARVINPMKADVTAACEALAGESVGVDCGFDAAGVGGAGVEAAVRGLRSGGTLVNIAQWKRPLESAGLMAQLTNREIVYRGSMCYESKDFEAIVGLLADGRLRAEEMVTLVVPLEETESVGYGQLINNTAWHVKILVKVQDVEKL